MSSVTMVSGVLERRGIFFKGSVASGSKADMFSSTNWEASDAGVLGGSRRGVSGQLGRPHHTAPSGQATGFCPSWTALQVHPSQPHKLSLPQDVYKIQDFVGHPAWNYHD